MMQKKQSIQKLQTLMSENQQLLNKVSDGGDFMRNGVCDYVTKYNYKAYNESLANLPDDPSSLE